MARTANKRVIVINQIGKKLSSPKLKRVAEKCLSLLGVDCYCLSVILSSDELMSSLNETYLSHRGSTDVITFCLGEGPERIEGEIYLGVEEIKRNSIEYNTSFWWELCFCLAHGILHLLGWEDYDTESQKCMHRKQIELLEQIGV